MRVEAEVSSGGAVRARASQVAFVLRREVENHPVGDPTIFYYLVE
jgi:hypothetical protein